MPRRPWQGRSRVLGVPCARARAGRGGGGGDLAGLGPGSAPGHREIKGGTGAVGCGDGDALHPPVVRHLRPPLIHWRHPAPGQVNPAAVTREPPAGANSSAGPGETGSEALRRCFVMCSSNQQTASYHVVDSRSDSSTAPQPPWLSQVAAECKSSVLRRQLRRRSSTVSRGRHPSAHSRTCHRFSAGRSKRLLETAESVRAHFRKGWVFGGNSRDVMVNTANLEHYNHLPPYFCWVKCHFTKYCMT